MSILKPCLRSCCSTTRLLKDCEMLFVVIRPKHRTLSSMTDLAAKNHQYIT